MIERIQESYKKIFSGQPLLVKSPGRINLIGEHVDYNDGFVLPAAIDRETFFAVGKSDKDVATLYSMQYEEYYSFDVSDPKKVDSPAWVNYLLGVVYQLQLKGHTLTPFNCVFGGNIPIGAGMSSSASIECGLAFALNTLFELGEEKVAMVHMAQMAEHSYAGVKCGIMDQFASMMGEKGCALLLDCRSLEYENVPAALDGYTIVLFDTKVKHSLASSEYNVRRAECEQGLEKLKKHYASIQSLRDVEEEMVNAHKEELNTKEYDRCLFVVQEIARVQAAVVDLKNGNLDAFGKKMFETHAGLSTLYEVSCPELDFLVDAVQNNAGVVGARMMGGGFGGCTINIVRNDYVPELVKNVMASFQNKFGVEPDHYEVNVEQGTAVVDIEQALAS